MSIYNKAKAFVPLSLKVFAYKLPKKFRYLRNRLNDNKARAVVKLTNLRPVPPGDLIFLVANHRHPSLYLDGGKSASQAIVDLLGRHNMTVKDASPVLEFGCGVGRIIRHFESHGARLYGTDYNPDLIAWCRDNLDFAEFNRNELAGSLPYADNTFGLIYTWSVFTHLDEPLQRQWIRELTRILRPGGFLYLTTHGEFYTPQMQPDERNQFDRGELVVRVSDRVGENICSVFHPKEYMKRLAPPLEIIDFVAEGSRGDANQDAWLLQKPTSIPPRGN
jgi:SAM-dependent methyltransferase